MNARGSHSARRVTAAEEHLDAYHEQVGKAIDDLQSELTNAKADIQVQNFGAAAKRLGVAFGIMERLARAWDATERLVGSPRRQP